MIQDSAGSSSTLRSVSIKAPARLHLGFLDLNASMGRRFGSIGMAINSHCTQLTVRPADAFQLSGIRLSDETNTRLNTLTERFYSAFGQQLPHPQHGVHIHVDELIPEHAGFGSGTQLALALGTALSHLHGIPADCHDLAIQLGRGKRSGIGTATFQQGGFVIDGGLRPEQTVPPVLIQQPFPKNWRVLLIMDPEHKGIHGHTEKQAFRDLPAFPLSQSQAICHLTLMQLLPALVEQDIVQFGEAITEIQALIGDHFSQAQGGRYTSASVAACLREAQRLGHAGIAQSSWGPTGCVFVDSESAAQQLMTQLQTFVASSYNDESGPFFVSAQANNSGANIERVP